MAIWDRVKDGMEKANRVAQDALDEGKLRMDSRRTRQAADKAAEALGYAVFRAWESGQPLAPEVLDRLARALRDHEQEAERLEVATQQAGDWRKSSDTGASVAGEPAPSAPASGEPVPSAPPTDAPPAGAPASADAEYPDAPTANGPTGDGPPPAGSPHP